MKYMKYAPLILLLAVLIGSMGADAIIEALMG